MPARQQPQPPAHNREELSTRLFKVQNPQPLRLGEILLRDGVVDEATLQQALAVQLEEPDLRLGQILLQQEKLDEPALYRALGERMQVPFVSLAEFDFDPAAISMLSPDLARRYGVIPLYQERDVLVVATDNPANSDLLDVLGFATGHIIALSLATPEEVDFAISSFYAPFDEETVREEAQRLDHDSHASQHDQHLARLGREKPVVRLVHNILLDAIRRRASDIHIRPREHSADLIFRIDGNLIAVRDFPKSMLVSIVNRIKILGKMDIAERRLPQDGRARIINRGQIIDLRLSVIPSIYGESVVIRILDVSHGMRQLNEIGFNPDDEQKVRNLLHQNQGLILVTGPTGSGKSTTLYAAMQEVRQENVNIITVEDPVEYHLDGINQIQVNPHTGYSFAKALRHILRHDPDVIMVGEIRDGETARMAVESALTGHLVLTTLHTNSAASSVTRLLEIGVDSYLVSATLSAVLAQRLVKLNCRHCMQDEAPAASVRMELGVGPDECFKRGAGCEHCFGTGFHGRRAVYELLMVTPSMRSMIKPGVDPLELEKLALAEGMRSLTAQALDLARSGDIPLSEVYRVRLT